MNKTKNQRTRILHFLQEKKSITPIQALNKFGCFRLSARIKELRDEGHTINTELVEINDSRVARYTLINSNKLSYRDIVYDKQKGMNYFTLTYSPYKDENKKSTILNIYNFNEHIDDFFYQKYKHHKSDNRLKTFESILNEIPDFYSDYYTQMAELFTEYINDMIKSEKFFLKRKR